MQQSEDVKEKIEDLIPRLARFKQNADAAIIDGDPAEERRRSELTRYAHRSLPPSIPRQRSSRSALEDIEGRSQALLAKGIAARFIDKGEDSKEVARLIKRLREAISHYQVSGNRIIASNTINVGEEVSQQQAIYDQITNLTVRVPRSALHVARMIDSFAKSSFGLLLKLHEVT